MKNRILSCLLWSFCLPLSAIGQDSVLIDNTAFQSLSSHDLLDYAAELSSVRYGGRLSGSPGYEASACWVAGKLRDWGLSPLCRDSSYFQWFPNPWTEVLHPGSVVVFPPAGIRGGKKARLDFPADYYPGSHSASGRVTGKVVYAGFGISAPELGYDDYAGVDVRGKIVMIEPGVPYSGNDSALMRWEPYSYHLYKFRRARELGAAGLLYTGLTANPNTSYLEGFVYAHVSEKVADGILSKQGIQYSELASGIRKSMQPRSFPLDREVAIAASTRHFPDARACNVVAMIEGSDPVLKKEVIILGGHLDAVGSPGMVFPGALDNASGCADLLGAAQALVSSAVRPLRSILFIFFGGEECGLLGSRAYVKEPLVPKEEVVCMINLDMVGNGTGFHLSGGASYPGLFSHFLKANNRYIHRDLKTSAARISYGRPRTDAAIFEKAGYPTLGLWTTGTVKPVYYHQPLDNTDALTPEIMEDAAKLLYLGVLGIANSRECP